MKRFATILLTLFVLTVPTATRVWAQTPTVEVGKTFQVSFNHDGLSITGGGFRLYVDDVKLADIPLTSLQTGSVTVTAPAVTGRGNHVLAATAFNPDRESVKTTLAFIAQMAAPNPPTNLKIVVTVALNQDGTVSLTWVPAPPQ